MIYGFKRQDSAYGSVDCFWSGSEWVQGGSGSGEMAEEHGVADLDDRELLVNRTNAYGGVAVKFGKVRKMTGKVFVHMRHEVLLDPFHTMLLIIGGVK